MLNVYVFIVDSLHHTAYNSSSDPSEMVQLLYLSGQNESDASKNNESEKAFLKTMEYYWHQNKDYVGGFSKCQKLGLFL